MPRCRILGVVDPLRRHSMIWNKTTDHAAWRRCPLRAIQLSCALRVRAATTCPRDSYVEFRNAQSGGRLVLGAPLRFGYNYKVTMTIRSHLPAQTAALSLRHNATRSRFENRRNQLRHACALWRFPPNSPAGRFLTPHFTWSFYLVQCFQFTDNLQFRQTI
jgi:hypothetical protein